LLWVFEKNVPAIRLYERMGFGYDEIWQKLSDGSGRIELRYRYPWNPDLAAMAADAEARQQDLDGYGVIYRVLGDRETSYCSPRWSSDSSTDSKRGSLVM
jgi:hypothetical protein